MEMGVPKGAAVGRNNCQSVGRGTAYVYAHLGTKASTALLVSAGIFDNCTVNSMIKLGVNSRNVSDFSDRVKKNYIKSLYKLAVGIEFGSCVDFWMKSL